MEVAVWMAEEDVEGRGMEVDAEKEVVASGEYVRADFWGDNTSIR